MTRDEVLTYLSDFNANKPEVSVEFPNGSGVVVNTQEAGFVFSPEDFADEAVNYGREDSLFANAVSYLKIKKAPQSTDLFEKVLDGYDEETVKEKITESVENYNKLLAGKPYEITETQLILKKGAGQQLADADALYTAFESSLYDAYKTGEDIKVAYTLPYDDTINLDKIYDDVFCEPVSAVYDKETGGVTPSANGISFDLAAAKKIYNNAATGDTIKIDLIISEPALSAANAEELLFRDLLHSDETSLVGNTSNRLNNVRLAAAAINGVVINPGETFSFNRTLGERTAAKGYKTATAYIGGKAVPDIGGGICQVSSSLYCGAVHSDLEIVERHCHMFLVSYLPIGIDATVAWSEVDFKFKNSTDFPIKLVAYVNGSSSLVTAFYGTKLDDSYITISNVVESVRNYDTVEKEDPSIPEGTTEVETSGRTGYVVRLYKNYYSGDGTLIKSEYLDTSDYDAEDRVILIPVKSETPEQPEDPENPENPEQPQQPEEPTTPEEPVTPEAPVTPEEPEESSENTDE